MHDEIAKVALDVQAIMNRFPEFDEVALGVAPVRYGPAGEGSITAYEACLSARVRDGQWRTADESPDVWSMNHLVDWSAPCRLLLRKIGLQADPIVFSAEEATVDLIAQKFSGRIEQKTAHGMASGM